MRKATKESIIRLGQVAQEIIEMAPESHLGYSTLAWYYWILRSIMESHPGKILAKAFKLAQKALSIDEY